MGESYLQRKVLDKMRRSRTQTSIVSSSSTTGSPATSLTHNDSPAPSSSSVSGHLETADVSDEQVTNSKQLNSDEENPIEQQQQQSVGGGSFNQSQHSDQTGSRFMNLKSASKAIVFFRRAASSVARVASHASTHMERQNTDDPNGPARTVANERQRNNSSNNNNVGNLFMVPNTGALRMPIVCLIRSIDGELMRELFVHRYELGQYLMESIKVSLNLQDSKYFGLRLAKHSQDQEDLENPWLDLNESVWKQIKLDKIALAKRKKQQKNQQQLEAGGQSSVQDPSESNNDISKSAFNQQATHRSIELYLRIKFYPPNVGRISDQFLRNYLWLQLRRDLRLGKLTSSMNNLAHLMACVLQFELGDYKPELIESVPNLNILPNQDVIEGAAVALWRSKLLGTVKHQAQMQFIRAAMILETYGFDYYPVRDHQRQRAYLLGFNYAGVKTIRNGRIVHHFAWHNLNKISYERRMIIFHVYPAQNSKRKQILGFKCLSNEDCQHLYLRLLEQKYFFTVDLAYFDQSIRRPSCLRVSQSEWTCSIDELTNRPSSTFSPQPTSPESRPVQYGIASSSFEQLSQHSDGSSADLMAFGAGRAVASQLSNCDTINIARCSLECCRPPAPVPPTQANAQLAETPEQLELPGRRCQWSSHLWRGRVSSLSLWLASYVRFIVYDSPIDPPVGGSTVSSQQQQQQRNFIAPAMRFCAAVIAMNFMLRLADSISSSLVELLSVARAPPT